MNSKLLKEKMVLRDMTTVAISKYIGINRSSWFRNITGKTEFTRREISLIASALSLDEEELIEIFFAKDVSFT